MTAVEAEKDHYLLKAAEVEQMHMTQSDIQKLQQHRNGQRMLAAVEVSLEQPLFVFQMCQRFANAASLRESEQSKKRKRKAASALDFD